jgi:D-tyrosyl-tRNA(Tyr) deacylase
VQRAHVSIDQEIVARIGHGLVVFVGVAKGDGPADIEYTASKLCGLRAFADGQGRMNRSILEIGGALLVISQFTLLADVRHGRRPAFDGAEAPAIARACYDALVARLAATGIAVATGRFQAQMAVELVNDGPVTILVDSRRTF